MEKKVSESTILRNMPMPSEQAVKAEIRTILGDTNSYTSSLNWAVSYCRAALSMTGEELRVQCLYILNNLSTWRHPQAKDIRRILKKFAGLKK